jgi:hypothetical protein
MNNSENRVLLRGIQFPFVPLPSIQPKLLIRIDVPNIIRKMHAQNAGMRSGAPHMYSIVLMNGKKLLDENTIQLMT